MIATLYTTVGCECFSDRFPSHEEARKAFELTVARAASESSIQGAVLDLGGRNVTIWNAA